MAKLARHVVVTGAGTGIGRAIALGFARKGTRLTLLARDLARLEATASEVRARGAEVQALACDIRKRASVDTCFASAAERFGPCTRSSPTPASAAPTLRASAIASSSSSRPTSSARTRACAPPSATSRPGRTRATSS
jgi:NAD(P)-dependent dehydrogenase (short-subunit alcohol dehydrogenase family)